MADDGFKLQILELRKDYLDLAIALFKRIELLMKSLETLNL
ncbi:hypothetical protein [Nostoc cycadae]|nr:hypothetical protein [Nostoc cycadae]